MARKLPSYRLHKSSGQAVVSLSGVDFYLGRHGTKASRRKYEALIAEWLANDRRPPDKGDGPVLLSVIEVVAAYWRFCKRYYRKPNGSPSSELDWVKGALGPVKRLYGRTPAVEFGPSKLKAVRQTMIEAGLARSTINHRISRVRAMFKWAVEQEMVEPSVIHALQAVANLKRGRSDAKETEPVRPVPDEHVDAIREHVPPPVWACVQLQRLTGMRSGEVTSMRGCDLDMTGALWSYEPADHKMSYRGRPRKVFLGAKAQQIIRPFLKADLAAVLFSPADAEAARNTERRRNRNTPLWPSHVKAQKRKRKASPRRVLGDRYTKDSYGRAIQRGCDLAFPPPDEIKNDPELLKGWRKEHRWHSHQLRHSAGAKIRKEFGLEAARCMLGHKLAAVTESYASDLDEAKAAEIAVKIG